MIIEQLQSPVVRAVLDLVAADSADQQAEVLTREGALFLTWGADGTLASLCQICDLCGGDREFVLRLEAMRIALCDVRDLLDDGAQVASTLRRFLPFGGPGAPTRPSVDSQPEFSKQMVGIVGAYLSAGAWRVRYGIIEAFPALFIESDLALEMLAKLPKIRNGEQVPGLAAAADYLTRIRAGSDCEQPRGLTGFIRAPSIRATVLPMLTEDEYTELSVYEYQECRSASIRAELLEENPSLASDVALQFCELLATRQRMRGIPEAVEAYESVARSLAAARTGDLDEAAALVRDTANVSTEAMGARLMQAMAIGDLPLAANILRFQLHQLDRQLAPNTWAMANTQLADILAHEASRAAGTSAFIIEEIVLRCLAALRVQDTRSEGWADTCIMLADALVNRIRGNRTANLEAASSVLDEVAEIDIANEDAARVHLGLATAYAELFGDSASENLRRALWHAERTLEIYQATDDGFKASQARLALGRVLVEAAGRLRGSHRMSLLDTAEEYLEECNFTPPPPRALTEREDAMIAQLTQFLSLDDETARSLRVGGAPVGTSPRVLALQLLATCKMLRYSDGKPDLAAQRAAVDLHNQALAEIDRDAKPITWARTMLSLASMYTRYPEPTNEMLNRAEQAQRAALDIFRAEDADYEIVLAAMALGNIAFRRGQWQEAANWLGEAVTVAAEGEEWSSSDRGVLAQVSQLRDSYVRLSYALYRAGRPAQECLEWLERGKTHLATERDTALFELDEVADAVPTEGAIVIPLITSQGSLLWIITCRPGGAPTLMTERLDDLTDRDFDVILYGSDATPGWVPAYNASLEYGDRQAFKTWTATIDHVCRALWRLIGVHIEASLRTAGLDDRAPVAIAPPRQLSVLPLHAAFRDDEDGRRRYLGDSYAITYTPSLRVLVRASARRHARTPAPPSLLAIADPLSDLPNAIAEANAVARCFPEGRCETLCGDAATTGRIAELASGHTHLHVACHGSFDSDNPSQSSLFLADAAVRVDDLPAILPLSSFDLVTLSACETGLLDNTRAPYEWLGIAGALARADTTDIVCTLWSIDDEATARLMEYFYQALIAGDMSPAQALQEAQSAMRNEPSLQHPLYWAAFMHVGAPCLTD